MAAIAQFGSPYAVADAFGGELATGYARRTIAWFIATGPLVGIWWLLLLIDVTMITLIMVSCAPSRPLMIIAFAASLTRIVCSITTVRHANLMRV